MNFDDYCGLIRENLSGFHNKRLEFFYHKLFNEILSRSCNYQLELHVIYSRKIFACEKIKFLS